MVLARGEQHNAAAVNLAVLLGEVSGEQQGGPCVDGEGEVELGGGELGQGLPGTAGVVGDQHVERPQGGARCRDHQAGGLGVGQVDGQVFDSGAGAAQLVADSLPAIRVFTPRLARVVRWPPGQEQLGTVGGQPSGDGRSDATGATDPGDHYRPTL